MKKARQRIPRVALLVETTRTYSRDILAGIHRYIATHSPWSTFIELRAPDSAPPPWLRRWDGDGIITRTFTQEVADLIAATKLPAIEIRATYLQHNLPFIGVDNQLIGRMVAEHFINRGYRNFAAYSLHSERFFVERVQNFVSTVEAIGLTCATLPEKTSESVADWEKNQARLVAWLNQLPKPVGVFAANDQLGIRLLDACQRAGISVPEEVAVVGAENDETLCEFSTPPLTSLQYDGEKVGYLAAQMLDGMMQGQPAPAYETLVPPKSIITRGSSDDLVINDQLVSHAVRMIRKQATQGLTVEDLCETLNTSHSTLERRMKAALNRTPKAEIIRIRLREVERLLRDTDLTIEAISEQAGFVHSHYLQALFKQRHRQTPGQFRKALPRRV
ncbi:DNA-binding transcriptional regulator [soil metagenome]